MPTRIRIRWRFTMLRSLVCTLSAVSLGVVFLPGLALAHTGHPEGGFGAGFSHPIFGWDHVAAMVAVGLWATTLGGRSLWLLPVVFPLVMAGGGALALLGMPLPGVESGIAASVLILGLLVLLAVRLPASVAAVLVGVFAIFHGHAHGTELPATADPVAYALGFVLATALLHLAGIALGLLIARPLGHRAVQAAGGVVALAGLGFLAGAF